MNILPLEEILPKILYLRGRKVLLDRDLAFLYQVTTKALNQAVRRNKARFPEDFVFQLSEEEFSSLKSQSDLAYSSENSKSQFVTSTEVSDLKMSDSSLSLASNLKSQFVTSSFDREAHGGIRKLPFAFTEQGVAMLSSVLRSERAIMVNIQIMRTFTRLRELIFQHDDLLHKLEAMEQRYDKQFSVVFDALRQLIQPPEEPREEIGFKT